MSQAASSPFQRRWTPERVARLGFLLGQGLELVAVARDPAIDTTPGNVQRQANRFGLALRDAADRRLPPEVGARLDAAADRRGTTRAGLVRTLVLAAGSDPSLIDNILDDDV